MQLKKRPWIFTRSVRFRARYPRRANLRFALLVPERCDTSPQILRDLRRHRCKHVLNESRRCVGFAFGTSRREPPGIIWYLLALQCDLAFCRSSRIRDYVRGWRRHLFEAILEAARREGVRSIAVPSAHSVAAAACWWISEPPTAPASWLSIYDQTALDYGLKRVQLENPIDLQLRPRSPAVLCDEFFMMEVNPSKTSTSASSSAKS